MCQLPIIFNIALPQWQLLFPWYLSDLNALNIQANNRASCQGAWKEVPCWLAFSYLRMILTITNLTVGISAAPGRPATMTTMFRATTTTMMTMTTSTMTTAAMDSGKDAMGWWALRPLFFYSEFSSRWDYRSKATRTEKRGTPVSPVFENKWTTLLLFPL